MSSDDDTDNRGRRYDPTATGVQNPRTTSVKSPQYRLCRREFLRRGLSLNRQKLAAGPQQSRRPASQPIQRRYRTRGRDIGANRARQFFRPPADNPNVL
jgi:hypothetical protein